MTTIELKKNKLIQTIHQLNDESLMDKIIEMVTATLRGNNEFIYDTDHVTCLTDKQFHQKILNAEKSGDMTYEEFLEDMKSW